MEDLKMKMPVLSNQSAENLRNIAVSFGIDRKKLYGTSKTALVVIINQAIANMEDNTK